LPGRAARIAWDRGGLLGVAVLALYAWVAPAHVVDGDNSEFALLGAFGGCAHPPGYPLFVLWLRATSWLPGSPAHAAALATCILAAMSVVVLHAACRAWGARPLAATLACGVFAGAPVVLAMYTEAEVFALNGVIVAGVLWLAAHRGPLRGIARAGALGLVAGLGLANQHTCALVAPIGILGIVRGVREAGGAARPLAAAALGLVVGLLPYLYLFVAPGGEGTWSGASTPHDLFRLFFRLEYGGPTMLATDRDPVPTLTSLLALVHTLGRTWLWLPAVAGLAAAVDRAVRRSNGDDREPRVGWMMWLVCFAVAGPLLATRFNVAPEGPGKWVVDRFHILPSLLLALPVADALDRVLARVRGTIASSALAHVAGLAVFGAVAGTALPHLLRVHAAAVERAVENTLRTLPDRAVVFGLDDDFGFAIHYVQRALHVRPDVSYVHMGMISLRWYRTRMLLRGIVPDSNLVDDEFLNGRPVFVQPSQKVALAAFPHFRYGILAQLLPRGTALPSLDAQLDLNRELYARFRFDYTHPGPDDEWPAFVHERYARTWDALAAQFAAAGRRQEAAEAAEIAREIGPHE
jgi:hypothetical protein